jgi:citrate lyase subunit beta/citryl-CoA lyase
MVARSGVTILIVPKADPAALDLAAGSLGQAVGRIALIETVAGYANLRTIAKIPFVSRFAL